VLRALIARHPELAAEAEQLSRAVVTRVDAEAVAAEVEDAVLALELGELNASAGRQRWGYVDPTEAAWELLEETLEPPSSTRYPTEAQSAIDYAERLLILAEHVPEPPQEAPQ